MGTSIRAVSAFLALLAAGIAGAADPADCAGFSAAKAAAFLGVPAAQVTRKVDRAGSSSLYLCAYAIGKATTAIAFSVEAAASSKKAAEEMERYRENLTVAGETAPFKGRLPKGAYSDIMGVGDEAVWTDVSGALTVRKGHLTIQATLPKDKLEQLKLVKAVLAKP